MERKRRNNVDAVEIPSEKEQQTQRTSTAQRMGAEACSASTLASYTEVQEQASTTDQNRRTSKHPGPAVIANAAIA